MSDSRLGSHRTTRRHPGESVPHVDNPERIIFPARGAPAPLPCTPARPASAPPILPLVESTGSAPLIVQQWDSIVNPSNPHGYPVITAHWPLSSDSILLDQLSDDSTAIDKRNNHPNSDLRHPRHSIPGNFDPHISFISSGDETIQNMENQQSTSQPPELDVSAEFARMKLDNDGLRSDNAGLRKEISEVRGLLQSFLQSQRLQDDDLEGNVTSRGETSTQRPAPKTDHDVTPQMFTSTPAVGRQNLFHVPPSLPSVAETPITTTPAAADLSNFRATDWPQYKGKFGDVAAFRMWQYQMETTFRVKQINRPEDRFRILPMVLANDPASSWCRRAERNFDGKTWDAVMLEMQGVVLPVGWDEEARERLRELTMKVNESVTAYCGRARMIQEEIGVDECDDEALANAVVGGTTGTFKAWLKMERVVKNSVDPGSKRFSFPIFQERLSAVYLLTLSIDGRSGGRAQSSTNPSSGMAGFSPAVQPRATPSTAPANSGSNRSPLSSEEVQARNIRFGAYMRSIGLCPRCKTTCNKWLGGCDARPSATFFSVPMEFPRAPPYPPAKGNTTTTATKPSMSAGTPRPPRRVDVATVGAGESSVDVAALNTFPDLGRADLAAYEQLIEQLNGPIEDDVVEAAEYGLSPDKSECGRTLIMSWLLNGVPLRILIDTGAGTNLLSENAVDKLHLIRRPLPVPVTLSR